MAPGPDAKRPPHILLLMTRPPNPMTRSPVSPSSEVRRRTIIAIGAVAGVIVGLAAVYGIGATQRNPVDAACRPAAELAKRLAPLAQSEGAAVGIAAEPKRVPQLAFQGPEGKTPPPPCYP